MIATLVIISRYYQCFSTDIPAVIRDKFVFLTLLYVTLAQSLRKLYFWGQRTDTNESKGMILYHAEFFLQHFLYKKTDDYLLITPYRTILNVFFIVAKSYTRAHGNM